MSPPRRRLSAAEIVTPAMPVFRQTPPQEEAPQLAPDDPNFEAYFANVALPPSSISPTYFGVKVYKTKKRWRTIDVYVAVSRNLWGANPTIGSSVGIQLYAVTQGVRTLVRTGRMSAADFAVGLTQRKVISYEGTADYFDLELSMAKSGNTASDTVGVAIIASNLVSQSSDDPFCGCVSLGDVSPLNVLEPGRLVLDASRVTPVATGFNHEAPLEIVGVTGVVDAVATGNADRWLHIHDQPPAVAVAGRVPRWSIPLPRSGGNFDTPIFLSDLFRARFITNILTAVVSTTPLITTAGAASDAAWNVYYR